MDFLRRVSHALPERKAGPLSQGRRGGTRPIAPDAADLQPAFLDPASGTVYIARYADGTPAPLHVLGGLPRELFVNVAGAGPALRDDVVAGFARGRQFHTRAEAAGLRDADDPAPQRIAKRLVFL